MDTVKEDLVGAGWVAQKLGISVYTVYPKARNGQLPCVRIGKTLRFRPSEIERMILDKSTPLKN